MDATSASTSRDEMQSPVRDVRRIPIARLAREADPDQTGERLRRVLGENPTRPGLSHCAFNSSI